MSRHRAFSPILLAQSARRTLSSVRDSASGRLEATGNVFTDHGLSIDIEGIGA